MMFTSAPTLNIPYARKVLEHLIAHPDEHLQATFGQRMTCGTKACVAGTTVLMDPKSEIHWGVGGTEMHGVTSNGFTMAVDHRAQQLLGLTNGDANYLFFNMDEGSALNLLGKMIRDAETVQAAAIK